MNPLTESLEGRVLFHTVAPFGINPNGSLVVVGTEGNDVINVTSDRGTIVVSVNLLEGFTFAAKDVKRVLIYGEAGDDRIHYGGPTRHPVVIHGGFGRDRITGLGSDVTIFGDAGNDTLRATGIHGVTLHGNNGNDRLAGSTGVDAFYGGRGKDHAAFVDLGEVTDGIESMWVTAS